MKMSTKFSLILNILNHFIRWRIKAGLELGLISGNPVEVTHTLKEVIGKLGINVDSTDYKRTDQEH